VKKTAALSLLAQYSGSESDEEAEELEANTYRTAKEGSDSSSSCSSDSSDAEDIKVIEKKIRQPVVVDSEDSDDENTNKKKKKEPLKVKGEFLLVSGTLHSFKRFRFCNVCSFRMTCPQSKISKSPSTSASALNLEKSHQSLSSWCLLKPFPIRCHSTSTQCYSSTQERLRWVEFSMSSALSHFQSTAFDSTRTTRLLQKVLQLAQRSFALHEQSTRPLSFYQTS